MTDRPTGPATEAGQETHTLLHRLSTQMKTCEMVPCPFEGLARRAEIQAAAAEHARIFAALPAALQHSRIYCDGEDLPEGVQCARCSDDAAALVAAIEKELEAHQ